MACSLSANYFNEGGADCPPKHTHARDANSLLAHFNEGGADCPPKPSRFYRCLRAVPTSMKGGRTAPRNTQKQGRTA